MDHQIEVRNFFNNLSSWREVSQRHFSNIIESHSNTISEAINDLVEEVSDLKAQLSVITKERNDLVKTVDSVNIEKKQLREKLLLIQGLAESGENDAREEERIPVDIIDGGEQGQDNSRISNENEEQVDTEDFGQTVEQDDNNLLNEQIYKCKQCSYTSVYEIQLKKHKKEVHEKKSNHERYAASQMSHLKSHIEAVHKMGDKKFKCEQCHFESSWKHALNKHIKAVHENLRNHVCGECGYATSRKDTLKQHIEGVHEKIKSHVCRECGYAAAQKGQLKTHIEAVHENKRSHVCNVCGYAASQKGALKKHLGAIHNVGRASK